MKVPSIAEEARRALADGHCVVIGLQTTGEVRWLIWFSRLDVCVVLKHVVCAVPKVRLYNLVHIRHGCHIKVPTNCCMVGSPTATQTVCKNCLKHLSPLPRGNVSIIAVL